MDKELVKKLAERLKSIKLDKPYKIMEVCGTHTTEFFKSGVKDIFPEGLTLVDGPGCPVCVTQNEFLDRAIEIGKKYNPIITTFGDMIKVPSSYSSLSREKSEGMDIRIVYSPIEAVDMAVKNPDREIIFLSVGFETTAPTEAVTILDSKNKNIKNFSLLAGNKLTPPAVKALLDSGEVNLDGFILPGHVCAIIGSDAWNFIADKYGKPCSIAGFEPHELIMGTISILELLISKKAEIRNEYKKIVKAEGNLKAKEILFSVFETSDTEWRGLGVIPGSGLKIRDEYAEFDSVKKFPVTPPEPKEHKGCRCGELLRGLIAPFDCPLFDKGCSPERPIGPCMVSSEGPCSAYYKYWRK